jgi:hypothetical protein
MRESAPVLASVRLSGWIEVDETLVGGLEEAVFGRQTLKKSRVVIAAQVDRAGIGRIRMRMISGLLGCQPAPFRGGLR